MEVEQARIRLPLGVGVGPPVSGDFKPGMPIPGTGDHGGAEAVQDSGLIAATRRFGGATALGGEPEFLPDPGRGRVVWGACGTDQRAEQLVTRAGHRARATQCHRRVGPAWFQWLQVGAEDRNVQCLADVIRIRCDAVGQDDVRAGMGRGEGSGSGVVHVVGEFRHVPAEVGRTRLPARWCRGDQGVHAALELVELRAGTGHQPAVLRIGGNGDVECVVLLEPEPQARHGCNVAAGSRGDHEDAHVNFLSPTANIVRSY